MREVFVIGVGMIRFGKFPDRGVRQMGEEVLIEVIRDADIKPQQIQVAYIGNVGLGADDTPMMAGQIALEQVGITGIPITQVVNGCGSGSNAVHEAWLALQSGIYDVALVLGIEKMSSPPIEMARLAARVGGGDAELEGVFGLFPPGIFAMMARRHMERFGTTREQIAGISVKNHRHGALNPLAHYQKELSLHEVLASDDIAYPLTLYECCPISDGAAAVIMMAGDVLKRDRKKHVKVLSSVQVSGNYLPGEIVDVPTTARAAKKAYEMAGLGPEDIDVAEVHDCFSIAEILHYEDLGFCPKGEGGRFFESGATSLGGKIPVNPSGGLLAKGHPLGATGVAQIVEVVQQLRNAADRRQVEGARIGLTHNGGGFRKGDIGQVAVHILGI